MLAGPEDRRLYTQMFFDNVQTGEKHASLLDSSTFYEQVYRNTCWKFSPICIRCRRVLF